MPSPSSDPATRRLAWGSVLAGVGLAAAIYAAAEVSDVYFSSNEFCTSCHVMKNTVEKELLETPHGKTASGVRPKCAHCHVSERLAPAMWDHLIGMGELYAFLVRDYSKPETFEERRARLAEVVRLDMLANDSKNCRRCHVEEAIRPARARGRRAHAQALEERRTCIACHYNLVHKEVALSPKFERAIREATRKK